tara:strand:+ start:105 stop:308 length:204 start_codon:yes stop_codon:yes gene_type:complete
MIEYNDVAVGDELKITGMGAPGFAKLGDVVTVTKNNGKDKLHVVNEAGEEASFALTCGAQRLKHVNS